MGLICPLGTFFLLECFVPLDVLSLGTFLPWDVLFGDVLSLDVMYVISLCYALKNLQY